MAFDQVQTKTITIKRIQQATQEVTGVSIDKMKSPKRIQEISLPRQVSMYLCRKLTTRSLPQIAHFFGKRDHTTVLYGVRKIEGLIKDGDQKTIDLVNRVESAVKPKVFNESVLSSVGTKGDTCETSYGQASLEVRFLPILPAR